MKMSGLIFATVLPAIVFCFGCAATAPSLTEAGKSPRPGIADIKSAFDRVLPNTTTVSQLKDLGFDIYSSPTVKALKQSDFAAVNRSLNGRDFDAGMERCLGAGNSCRGFQLEFTDLRIEPHGHFWPDLLNFRRTDELTGWWFRSVFFIMDDRVVEKAWNGSPSILIKKSAVNPLKPFH